MHLLKDFKSFSDAKLNLFKPVTLLVGKNGSGKTNAIEGIELLAQLAAGTPLYEISDIGRSSRAYEVRGGLLDCVRNEGNEFTLGFSASIKFGGKRVSYCYEVSVSVEGEPHVCREFLKVADRTIFDANYSPQTQLLNIVFDNFARGGNKPSVTASADRSVLSRYSSLVTFPEKANKTLRRDALGVVSITSRYLNASVVFDPSPKLMRGYERINQSVLRRDGGNVSSVLRSLANGDAEQQRSLQIILERISHLPEEPFLNFEFIETSQGDVLFALRSQDRIVDARMLSDGTLRALAILAALESAPEKSRVVIEEIDNGIHPSRVKVLLDALWDASARRNLNLLVTTHNPATLNALNSEQLEAVVVCARDSDASGSVLVPLSDFPRIEGIFAGGRLGDYVTRDVLERHLRKNYQEEQRKIALDWLSSLQ